MGSKSLCGSRALPLLACLLGLLLVAVNADFRSSIVRLNPEDLVDTNEHEFQDPADVNELLASLPSALTHPEELAATPSAVGGIEDGFAFLQSLPSTDAAGAHVTDFTLESLAAAGAEADAAFELAGVEDTTDTETDALLDELAALDSFGSLNLSPEVALSFSMSGSMSFSDELSFSLSEVMSLSFSGFSYEFSYEFSADFSGSMSEFSMSAWSSSDEFSLSSSSSGDFSLSMSGGDFSYQFSDFSAGNSDFSMSGELSFSASSSSSGFSDFSFSEDFSDFSGSLSSSGALSGDGTDDGTSCTPTRCENGGTCIDGPTGFFCECASHYSGVTCSDFTEPTVATMGPLQITHTSSDHVYIQWSLPAYPALSNLTGFTMTLYTVVGATTTYYTRYMLSRDLLSARISGLEVETMYAFEIYARTADDYGLPSPRSLAITRYAAPWGLGALTLGDLAEDSMTASWTDPEDLNAYTADETYFILELSYTAQNEDGTSTDYTEQYDGIYEREYTFVGLSPYTNYSVSYYAANPSGVSDRWSVASAILPTSAPQIVGFYALNNPSAPADYGLSVGDLLYVQFDIATNTPALTAATVYNLLQFNGATGTLALSPVWTDASTLELTITSYSGTFPLGEVTVSIGDATSIAAGSRIGLYAAAELGGSLEASSGTSDPVGGNFGFAESFLSFTGTAATDEDVPALLTALGVAFLPGTGTTVLDLYIKPFRAGAMVSIAGLPVGNSSTPLHLHGTPTQLAALFSTVVYTPASNMNGYGGLSFNFEASGSQIYFNSLRVLVRPVNDAPVLSMPTTLSVDVDAATAVSGITVSDVDTVLNPLATLKVAVFTNSELHQCWFTAATAGVAYTSGSFSAKAQKVEVTGRVELVQSALRRLNCSFGLDDVMNVPTLTVVVDDQANGATAISTDRSSAIVSSVAIVTVSCVRAALNQPTLTFAADATAVQIRFVRTTQIPSPADFNCAEWFDAASLAALGTDPMCFGVSSSDTHTLTAQLGLGSTISLDQTLTLKAFKRCPSSLTGWAGGARPVGAPASPLAPTVVIDAPGQVASCDPLTVTAVPSGTGGRDVSYTWTSSPAGFFPVAMRTVQSPTVTGAAAGTYTLSVRVTNFVGGVSALASTVVTVQAAPAPQIRIQGGARQSINYRRNGNIRVGASAELAPCFAQTNRAVDFTWSSANAVATAAIIKGTGTTLILDAATLVPGVYTFMVEGVQQATPTVTATATLELTIKPAPLSLVRGSGPFQKHSNVAFSVTPEYAEVEGVTTYTWTCLNSGSPCYNKLTKSTFATAALTTTFSYAAGTFGPGMYSLTHTVTSGSRTFTTPISLEVLPAPTTSSVSSGTGRRLLAASTRVALPTIAVSCTGCQTGTGSQTTPWVVAAGGIAIAFAATVTPDVSSLTCTKTYAWEVSPSSALSLASTTPNAAYFTLNQELAGSFFALNQQYQLSLTSTATCSDNSVQTGTVTLYFATAKPPVNGRLTTAFVTNSDAVPMVLTAANWFSLNVPLTFTFYHRDSAGAALQYITSDIKKPNDVTWARPIPGLAANGYNRLVGVIARDSYGNQATFEKSVRINPDVRVVESNATSSVTATVTEQSGKGSTEGVNQVVAAWGKAFTSAGLPPATVVQLRNLLLTSALTTVSSSSAAAMISSVLAAQGSTAAQMDGNTALLASRIVNAALASLTSYGASGAANALSTAAQVASSQLTAASAGVSGRRLLSIAGGDETKAAVNSSYATLYAAMSAASRTLVASPGAFWRTTSAPASMTVARFAAASGLSTIVLSASMGPAGSNASVIVPSGLAASGNMDLHLIYAYPNPFTWDAALPTLVSGAVTVRYASTTGELVSSVITGHVTSVFAPWTGSCAGTGCTPACVLWTGQAWTTEGVTTGASSTDGVSQRVRCDVSATTSLPTFTVSLKAVTTPDSTTGGSTGGSQGTTTGTSTGTTTDTTTGTSTGTTTGGTSTGYTEISFLIATPASFPANFNELVATELATAAKPASGLLADYVARFQVMSHESVEVATVGFRTQATKTKVVVRILDSAGGVSSATLFANLLTASASGLSGTYLSSMTGLVQRCADGQYLPTCDGSGTSSGVHVTQGSSDDGGSSMGGIIGGVVGGVVVLALVIGGVYRYKRNRPPKVHDSSSVATDAAAGGNVA